MVYRTTRNTEERKDEKRKLIFETATKVFAENGYLSSTVKDITDEAGISVGTFYLYFKNKEDLLEKLYDEMAQIMNDVVNFAINNEFNGTKNFTRAITASMWAFQKYRDLAHIMLIEAVGLNPRFEQKRAAIAQQSCDRMEQIFKTLQEKGVISITDAKVAALAFEGTFNVRTYWLQNKETNSLVEYAYPLVVYNLQALKLEFKPEEVKTHIDEILVELENSDENERRDSNE